MSEPVCLQISVAPVDLPHAREIVPHQLRQWAGQVDEALVTVDTRRGHGRFGADWDEHQRGLDDVLARVVAPYPHARVEPVDYSEAAVARVAERFFDGSFVPPKDFRGGPFYTYFYGLLAARHERVLHVDCDMMFGGGSQHWIAEACKILDTRADVLACSPLPGPPTERGRLRTQDALPEPVVPDAFRFDKLSTRLFLLDRRALAALGPFPLSWPVRLPDKLRALARGGPRYALPEDLVTRAMRRANLVRLDFLGTAPGMWSVHPATRDERFYACLPRLIARIERGDVSDDQRGAYDLSPGMLEW